MGERYGDSVGNEEGEFSKLISLLPTSLLYFWLGEKPGNEPEEVKLQNASKQIVQNAILQAVQQVSQESQPREDKNIDARGRSQLGVQELTKKHEKK
ncbi:A-kinase anchor protein inhibitor 1 [Marmota flaviventris]|uniref:A-kinase anchor protein inhibitor 1 n=1 Tax=Marmota flaviventris TaxID=93162 RepID=UPI003A8C6B25